ncbi:hypothetical protein [uncultured Duncaniella sp.]|uniref:hypothetical protein n=1 Tax=uncultured Duncaniella sp. TaxID=2768039 RepID=UPI0025A9A682|nr:hypothetical protein [uncultured Duncaniella sp.]
MSRYVTLVLIFLFSLLDVKGQVRHAVVADSANGMPLSGTSVFDRDGNIIGMCGRSGTIPYVSSGSYPLTLRCLGYEEKVVRSIDSDTIFLRECITELPEVVIESRQHKVLHVLAYMREYSTLSTYTDTVFLFREKMVDYMLLPDEKIRFRGWSMPRVIKSRSYYRFTNAEGLDSVSDECVHHFSWSDWLGVKTCVKIPTALNSLECGADTLRGRYGPSEIWIRNNDRMTVDVDVLADTVGRKWIPNLSAFFKGNLDFENFRVRFNYDNLAGDAVSNKDLTGYSFNIESRGRGHDMFRFNNIDEPFFVTTYGEVYMIDKEYITVKEAKEWEKHNFAADEIGMYIPKEAPEIQPPIQELVRRVGMIDKGGVRLNVAPDVRLISPYTGNRNFHFGRRVLLLLKEVTGITLVKSHRNMNNNWRKFRKETMSKKSKGKKVRRTGK